MEEKKSRTQNTIYNFSTGILGQFLTFVMQFLVRTVFVATLGKSYLGINGLFSNILTMLSLAEFGVGGAILFHLYEPLEKGDKRRITLLMRLYKRAYTYIGAAVAVLGLCLIPFLPLLINGYDELETLGINVVFIFILYLLQSVSSYLFWAFKTAIIQADQKEYMINVIGYIFTAAANVLQMISLILVRSFELYVFLSIVSMLGQNYTVARMADRLYPYINNPTEERVSAKEIVSMVRDCGALFLYKLNSVVLKATDNIVVSVFLGLEMVGMYSNYYVFYTAINTFFNKVFNAVSHSLGNLHATHDVKREYQIFETVNIVAAVLGGTASVGIFLVADEFVDTWIGSDWLLPQPFALLMGVELYTQAFRILHNKYRNTMGLFQQAKFRPVAGMVINLVVSILLVKDMGICGVLLGTIIADWTTMMWFDPIIIHRYGFENAYPASAYYIKNVKYLTVIVLTACLDRIICSCVLTGYGWASVVFHTLVCGITVPAAIILSTMGTDEGRCVIGFVKAESGKVYRKLLKRG